MSFKRPKLEDFDRYFSGGVDFLEGIDQEYLKPGCREPDCIPSIDDPEFVDYSSIKNAWSADTKVLVLVNPEEPREAYAMPKNILDLHEIVNFNFSSGLPVALTYCPLCDTSASYVRLIDGEELDLGVSGLLYNSAVIVYDRNTNSLFSQVYSKGIHGVYKNKKLDQLPMFETSLGSFADHFSEGLYLSENTGFPRRQKRYHEGVYHDYRSSDRIVFPTHGYDDKLTPKSSVYHLETPQGSIIISKAKVMEAPEQIIKDLHVQPIAGGRLFFRGELSAGLDWDQWHPSIASYYFAARAYFPEAELIL